MTKSWQLFTNINYYLELLAGGWKKTWLVYLSWVGIISLAAGVWIAFQAQPTAESIIQNFSDQTISQIPTDVRVNWDGTQLHLSPKPAQPIKVAWPKEVSEADLPKYFVHYQPELTAMPSSQTDDANGSSLFFINPAQIWVADFSNQSWSEPIEIKSLPGFNDLAAQNWEHADLVGLVGQAHLKITQGVKIGLIAFPLLNVLLNWWTSWWFSLIEASFIWVLCKLIRWQLNWQKIFKLSLLIMPAATAMQLLSGWIYPDTNWSFFHLTYWLIFVLVNLKLPNLISQPKKI